MIKENTYFNNIN